MERLLIFTDVQDIIKKNVSQVLIRIFSFQSWEGNLSVTGIIVRLMKNHYVMEVMMAI